MGLQPSKIDESEKDGFCPDKNIRILKFDEEDTLFQLQFGCARKSREQIIVAMEQFHNVPENEKEMWQSRNATAASLAEKAVRIIGTQNGREFFETTAEFKNRNVTAPYLTLDGQNLPNGAFFFGHCNDEGRFCTFTYEFEK